MSSWAPPQLQPGQIFAGKYSVVRLVKAGGMGAVYEVRHTGNDKRWALKLMHPELAQSADARERFTREAKIDGLIESAFVVSVIDAGLDEATGTPFLVMEFLNGEELGELLAREGRIAPERALTYLEQVARALDKAHAKKIVHRDLKPDNLFLCRSDDEGEKIKVLDFGIAKFVERVDVKSTQGGGTPLYMAPEQTQKNGDIGPWTDVWALGLIAYALLVGRPYWHAETMASLYGEILELNEPRELATVRAARHGVTLPPAFDAWFSRCTNKDPRARFPRAGEAIAELARALSVSRVSPFASAPTVPHSAMSELASMPTVLPPTTGDALQPPSGAITTGAPQIAEASPRSQSPEQKGSSRFLLAGLAVVAVAGLAYGASRFLRSSPSSTDATSSIAPAASSAAPMRNPDVGLRALASFQAPKGSQVALLDSQSFWDSCAQDFGDAMKQSNAPARWSAGERFCFAESKLIVGDLPASTEAFRAAIAKDATWAAPHAGLAIALVHDAKADEALAAAREAERLEPSWVGAIWTIARVLTQSGKTNDAIQEYRRALAVAPNDPAILADFALVLHASRLDGEADRYAKQALDADPDLVSVHIMLAERALETKDAKTALEHATRALANDPNSAPARLAQAEALNMLGRKDEAMTAYRQAVEAWDLRRSKGGNEPRIAVIRAAIDAGKLPPARGANATRSATPRTACPPGDPLCSVGEPGRHSYDNME